MAITSAAENLDVVRRKGDRMIDVAEMYNIKLPKRLRDHIGWVPPIRAIGWYWLEQTADHILASMEKQGRAPTATRDTFIDAL